MSTLRKPLIFDNWGKAVGLINKIGGEVAVRNLQRFSCIPRRTIRITDWQFSGAKLPVLVDAVVGAFSKIRIRFLHTLRANTVTKFSFRMPNKIMQRLRIDQDIRSMSEFRTGIASFLKQVHETKRPLIITQHGKGAAVLLDVGEYEAMQEELELMKDIQISIVQLENGEGVARNDAP